MTIRWSPARHGPWSLAAALAVLLGGPPVAAQQPFDPEARLRELEITLPTPDAPIANYVKAVRTGNLVFLAGHGPCGPREERVTGKVGRERTLEDGYYAARMTGVCLLASLKAEIGDLKKVVRVVKVLGMVNAVEDFDQQPRVVNGFSDLMVAVFGDRGKHARSAVGMGSLPGNMTVEIEMIVEVQP